MLTISYQISQTSCNRYNHTNTHNKVPIFGLEHSLQKSINRLTIYSIKLIHTVIDMTYKDESTNIRVSIHNRDRLLELGYMDESYDYLITRLLNENKEKVEISTQNKNRLLKLGHMGESYDLLLSRLLDENEELKKIVRQI